MNSVMWKGEAAPPGLQHVLAAFPLMNTLTESSDYRSPVLYHTLLTALTKAVKRYGLANPQKSVPLFRLTPEGQWIFDVDALAVFLAEHFSKLPQESQHLFDMRQKSTTVSVHFADLLARQEFAADLLQLKDALQTRIIQAVQAQLFPESPSSDKLIGQAMQQILPSMKGYLNQAPDDPTDLRYANLRNRYPLKMQRLHLRKDALDVTPCLKGHRLEIRIDCLKDIPAQIAQGVLSTVSYMQQQGQCTEQEVEALQKKLEEQQLTQATTDLEKLSSAIVDQALPRLQRTASLCYLAFLSKVIQDWAAPKQKEALPFLRILQKRLERLEAYISDPNQEDVFYQAFYQERTIKLRELLCRANAFDPLPIIPLIGGKVGETYEMEQAQKTFIFGVKLKLNGSVHAHGGDGAPVFDYRTDFFRPDSTLYQKRAQEALGDDFEQQAFLEKVLSTALLYLFVFKEGDNEAFDPAPAAEEFFTIFHGADDLAKQAYLQQLSEEIHSANAVRVQQLRAMLVAFLHNPKIGAPSSENTLLLSLDGDILSKDPHDLFTLHHFFKDDWTGNNGKDILKYISVDDDSAGSNAICRALLHGKCYPWVSFLSVSQAAISVLRKLSPVGSKLPLETIRLLDFSAREEYHLP